MKRAILGVIVSLLLSIPATAGQPLENSVVILDGDRIQAVGRVGELAVPQGAEVISADIRRSRRWGP